MTCSSVIENALYVLELCAVNSIKPPSVNEVYLEATVNSCVIEIIFPSFYYSIASISTSRSDYMHMIC